MNGSESNVKKAAEALKCLLPIVGTDNWRWLHKSEAVSMLSHMSRSSVLRALKRLEEDELIVTKHRLGSNRRAVGVALIPKTEPLPEDSQQATIRGARGGRAEMIPEWRMPTGSTEIIQFGNSQEPIIVR